MAIATYLDMVLGEQYEGWQLAEEEVEVSDIAEEFASVTDIKHYISVRQVEICWWLWAQSNVPVVLKQHWNLFS